MANNISPYSSSYRDPSGFIFLKDGIYYRQVNTIFKEHFDHFISSGCYKNLVEKGLLIPHTDEIPNLTGDINHYKTIKPEQLFYISYPYEWSFDMLKDAALLTLQLIKESIPFGLILKDATPYNIQFHKGRLIFIDTLSFEKYQEEEPWIAYRQFCESFLASLLLMHYSKNSLQQILLAWPEGVPLSIARSLLPKRSRFSLHTYLHIHLHASIVNKKNKQAEKKFVFSKQKMLNLISSLETLIIKLKLTRQQTTWSEYYEEAMQRNDYVSQKKEIIEQWVSQLNDVKTAIDLGANEGEFSRILSSKDILTIATDADPYCINKLYNEIKIKKENIQPLIIDLANPSPSIGVLNKERDSFLQRTKTDLALALALVHHLAIGRNIPFEKIFELFASVANHIIVEFVPKNDPKVQLMLQNKKDIYTNYIEELFEKEMSHFFIISQKQKITGTDRILYLGKRLQSP